MSILSSFLTPWAPRVFTAERARNWSWSLLSTQAIALLLCTLLSYPLWNNAQACTSVLLGGLTIMLPNAYLLFRGLAPKQDQSPKHWMRTFFACECTKFLLTALLCFVSFAYLAAQPIPFFLGFLAPLFAFVFFFTQHRKRI